MSDPNVASNVVTAWQPGVAATNLWHSHYTIKLDARNIYSNEGNNGETRTEKRLFSRFQALSQRIF